MTSNRPAAARVAQLDALRAIAALLVLCMHVSEAMLRFPLARGGSTVLYTLSSGLDFGRAGVVLFFVISGYVVPTSLKQPGLRGVARFLVQRIARLYPAFWLSILPGAWSGFWLWGKEFGAGELWLNATMLPQSFGARPALWPYWTLRVEWIFYALCIVLHVGGLLQSTRIRAALMTVCGLLFVHGSLYEVIARPWFLDGVVRPHMLGFVSLFFYGSLLVSPGPHRWATRLYASMLCVMLPLLGMVVAGHKGADRTELAKLCFAYPAGVAMFLGGMGWLPAKERVLSWIGLRSYSLYLFHLVVLNLLLWCAERPSGSAIRECSLVTDVLIVALSSVTIAHIVHKYVELPGGAIGRRVLQRWPSL